MTNRKRIIYVALLFAVLAVTYLWSISRDYTDRKGEAAVKIISDDPDALFTPEGNSGNTTEKNNEI